VRRLAVQALALCMFAVPPLPAAAAPAAVSACAGCHGPDGRGNAAAGAPNIGGMDAWYVERQLRNFISGARGADARDTYGSRMRAAVVSLVSPEQARAVAEQVAAWPRSAAGTAAKADLTNGRNYYNAICSACHNSNGLGTAALGAPRLAGIDPDYLLRQLAAYRSGMRGAQAGDTAGAAMRRMATALPNAVTDRDVIAFIATLPLAPAASH